MKTLSVAFALMMMMALNAFGATRVVTIEGPVQVVRSPSDANSVVYWIEDPTHVKYQVVLPQAEQVRLASVIERAPATVIRFDGTIVDNEAAPRLNVSQWNTVTRTTTVTDGSGNTKTIEEHTTTTR